MSEPTRPRRLQRRSQETRARLVAAALHEFADKGFGGASTRSIATRARVAQSALPYHFVTKEALWKAAADHAFGLFQQRLLVRLQALGAVDAPTRAQLIVRDFVRFAADHPEMHRFMLQEGTGASERLEWLVDTHVRPLFEFFRGMFDELATAGRPLPGRPEHVFYMIIGAAATPYALAPEVRLSTGEDVFEPEMVEAHVEAVVELFFPRPEGGDG